jgi:hypothetical protein
MRRAYQNPSRHRLATAALDTNGVCMFLAHALASDCHARHGPRLRTRGRLRPNHDHERDHSAVSTCASYGSTTSSGSASPNPRPRRARGKRASYAGSAGRRGGCSTARRDPFSADRSNSAALLCATCREPCEQPSRLSGGDLDARRHPRGHDAPARHQRRRHAPIQPTVALPVPPLRPRQGRNALSWHGQVIMPKA